MHSKRINYNYMNAAKQLAFMLIAVITFTACDSNRIFEDNETIDDNVWIREDVKTFEVDIIDTLSPNNFYVNVRNADGYPYRNVYLFIQTTFPQGSTTLDTINCIIADEKGQYLGSGMGDIFDNQILLKKNVIFPQSGKYTFKIQHGMRRDKLPLIMDVGMRIEKAE